MLFDGVEPTRRPCSRREETSWDGASAHLLVAEGRADILRATSIIGSGVYWLCKVMVEAELQDELRRLV